MKTRTVVVPLLTAGACSAASAQNSPTPLYVSEDLQPSSGVVLRLGTDSGRLLPGGGAVLLNTLGDQSIEAVYVGPDGSTSVFPIDTGLPGTVPNFTPVSAFMSAATTDGRGLISVQATDSSIAWSRYHAYFSLSEAGIEAVAIQSEIADPSAPFVFSGENAQIMYSFAARSQNASGAAIARPSRLSLSSLIAFDDSMSPRTHRVPGTLAPGVNQPFVEGVLRDEADNTIFPRPTTAAYQDISSAGHAAYIARYGPSGSDYTSALFLESPDHAGPVMWFDRATSAGYRLVRTFGPGKLRVNASGLVAIIAEINDGKQTSSGIWTVSPQGEGVLRAAYQDEFIRPGATEPITLSLLNQFSVASGSANHAFVLSDSGDIAFVGQPFSFHSDRAVAFAGVDGRSEIMFSMEEFPESTDRVSDVIIAENARSAAIITGGGHGHDTGRALVIAGVDRSTTVAARAGDVIEVAPGDLRVVDGFYLRDHRADGRTLFDIWFTDGSRGVFYYTIPACPADLNNNGVVDADDFFLFLQFFAAGDPRADINNDGVINADDFFDYLDLFALGC